MAKPILCLDFDGVIHSYSSGWIEPDFIPDLPVPGAFEFIFQALKDFDVKIYSSRSKQENGIRAMCTWVRFWAGKELDNKPPSFAANTVLNGICYNKEAWPTEKPPAFLTIDDRALTFTGEWPTVEALLAFKPWNKKEPG